MSTSTRIRTQRAHAVKYDATDEKEFRQTNRERKEKCSNLRWKGKGEVVFFFEFNQWIIIVTLYFTVYSDTYCESSDMCRDENLHDVHSIKNGRFHEWYEDYKISDWIEVGPVEARPSSK